MKTFLETYRTAEGTLWYTAACDTLDRWEQLIRFTENETIEIENNRASCKTLNLEGFCSPEYIQECFLAWIVSFARASISWRTEFDRLHWDARTIWLPDRTRRPDLFPVQCLYLTPSESRLCADTVSVPNFRQKMDETCQLLNYCRIGRKQDFRIDIGYPIHEAVPQILRMGMSQNNPEADRKLHFNCGTNDNQ